jgi:hypothetical protein
MSGEFKCSMTRANKLLAQLRDAPETSHRSRRAYGEEDEYPGTVWLEIGALTSSTDEQIDSQLANMKSTFELTLLKRKLSERWKNRLFTLNIQYGISAVLSDLDLCRNEKDLITKLLRKLAKVRVFTLPEARASMGVVNGSEKKYDFAWNVSSFNKLELEERLRDIQRRVSALDDSKDLLNARNEFSIELTEAERSLLAC